MVCGAWVRREVRFAQRGPMSQARMAVTDQVWDVAGREVNEATPSTN